MPNALRSLLDALLTGLQTSAEKNGVHRVGRLDVGVQVSFSPGLFRLGLSRSRPAATTSTMRGTVRNAAMNQLSTNSSSSKARTQARSGQGLPATVGAEV
jgi:hypothetical protein